jgi:hypothetical protein
MTKMCLLNHLVGHEYLFHPNGNIVTQWGYVVQMF